MELPREKHLSVLSCRRPGEVMLSQTEIVQESRVSSTLKTFNVTKHDLSIIVSSSPSLLEAVTSSQPAKLCEIVHPRSQSWEKQVSPALEAVKKGSPQLSWRVEVISLSHSLNLRCLKWFPHLQRGLRWRQEHHWRKKKKGKRNKNFQNKKSKSSKWLQ